MTIIISVLCLFTLHAEKASMDRDILQPVNPDTTVTITYVDNYSTKDIGVEKLAKPIRSRKERTSEHAGRIKIEAPDIPQEIVDCAEIAVSIWESIINRNSVFKIEIQTTSMVGDFITTVSYYREGSTIYPVALRYLDSDNIEEEHIPLAGIIQINNDIDWDYSVDGNVDVSKRNLTYGLIRAIGRILGFGSSVKCLGNGYAFSNKYCHSIFDSLVTSSDGTSLISVPLNKGKENTELLDYINKGGHTVGNDYLNYNLAAPPYSISNPPFCALEKGLMKPTLNVGDYCIQVDDDVWNVLKMIGWELKSENTLDIVCPDATNGIVDAAEPHDFNLSNRRAPLANPRWKLTLPLSGGGSHCVDLKDKDLSCTVPDIAKEASKYETDINGFIRGHLEFSGFFNGLKIEARPYNIFFDTEPRILSVDIEDVEYSDDRNFFRVHYTVRFRGADYLDVLPKEEFSSIVSVRTFREPILAKGCTDWLFSGGQVRLRFCARADSKECSRTIIFDPFTQDYREMSKESAWCDNTHNIDYIKTDQEDTMDVYSLDGVPILKNVSISEIVDSNLEKGTYIICRRDTEGNVESSKILLR